MYCTSFDIPLRIDLRFWMRPVIVSVRSWAVNNTIVYINMDTWLRSSPIKQDEGVCSRSKYCPTDTGIPIITIRRSDDRLIFIMGTLYLEGRSISWGVDPRKCSQKGDYRWPCVGPTSDFYEFKFRSVLYLCNWCVVCDIVLYYTVL